MKKFLTSITLIFIVSCGKQTAPALELQDTDSAKISSDVKRVELPNPQEATFAAETEVIEESNPTETPEHGPATDVDKDKKIVSEKPKKEIKVDPEVLFPDFAWEKYMVEPGDYLIKIAKKEYGDFVHIMWDIARIDPNEDLHFKHFVKLCGIWCIMGSTSRIMISTKQMAMVPFEGITWLEKADSGKVTVDGNDITNLSPAEKLKSVGVAYILQDNSVFPDMTVEENILMGGYIKDNVNESYEEAEKIFEKYDRLKKRRNQPAKVLSGGERRLLEISRALVMKPSVLLVDEPSIGLEPRYIDMVFEILGDLQKNENKTIVLVEQNAKKGLEFSDIGYVMTSGKIVLAGPGNDLLEDPNVGRLFLGG